MAEGGERMAAAQQAVIEDFNAQSLRVLDRSRHAGMIQYFRIAATAERKGSGARHGAAAPAAPLVQTIWPDRYDDI